MNEPIPWEIAAKKMKSSFATVAIIKEACEEHTKTVTAERDRLAAQLKLANEDWAEDDTAIRELCRPILGDAEVDGDSYGVPSVVTLVERLVTHAACRNQLDSQNAALRAERDQLKAENIMLRTFNDSRSVMATENENATLREQMNQVSDALLVEAEENAALRAQVKRLREALNAVLLWHSGSPWTEVKKMQWWNLTQTEEATTRILCDTVRLALGKLPSCFGDFTGKLPTDIPSDMQLSHEQRNALEHLADTQQEAGQ